MSAPPTPVPIRLWFVCKLCKDSFHKVEKFIEHKKQSHFSQFQKLNCIVFEESSYSVSETSNTNFSDGFSNPPILFNEEILPDDLLLPENDPSRASNKNEIIPDLQIHENEFPVIIKAEPVVDLNELKPFEVVNPNAEETESTRVAEINDQQSDADTDVDADADPFLDLKIKNELEEDSGDERTSSPTEREDFSNLILTPDLTFDLPSNFGPNSTPSATTTVSTKPVFKCHLCSKEFMREYSLKFHIESHKSKDQQSRPFVCLLCGSAFRAKFHLTEHLVTHSDDTPFHCTHPNCTEKFKRRAGLLKHQKTHSDFRPFPCPVPGCRKAFKDKRAVQLHMTSHTDERPFHCSHGNCGKTFKRYDHLVEHVKTKHCSEGEKRTFQCGICHITCQTNSSLKKHSLVHIEERPFKCPFHGCTADFKRKRNLEQHERVHSK